jgi:hypothetical protein
LIVVIVTAAVTLAVTVTVVVTVAVVVAAVAVDVVITIFITFPSITAVGTVAAAVLPPLSPPARCCRCHRCHVAAAVAVAIAAAAALSLQHWSLLRGILPIPVKKRIHLLGGMSSINPTHRRGTDGLMWGARGPFPPTAPVMVVMVDVGSWSLGHVSTVYGINFLGLHFRLS